MNLVIKATVWTVSAIVFVSLIAALAAVAAPILGVGLLLYVGVRGLFV